MKVQVSPIYSLITTSWLVLLGFSGIIGAIIAPFYIGENYLISLVVGVLKILVGFVFIMLWLIAWYNFMQMSIQYMIADNE